jgi:Ca2+-binding EF-hand superfamily protein
VKLTEEEKEDFSEVFEIFDEDNSGSLSKKELKIVMQAMGANYNDEQIEEVMKKADQDNDQAVSKVEFLGLMCDYKNSGTGEVKYAYDEFCKICVNPDADKADKADKDKEPLKFIAGEDITEKSMKQMFFLYNENMDEDDFSLLIKEMDFNKDGKVDFKDFMRCLVTV